MMDVDDESYQGRIIAIGASAGGLSPLRELISLLGDGCEAAVIVAMHLSKKHVSKLDEIVGRETGLATCFVDAEIELHPSCVYVIPPGKDAIMSERKLCLVEPVEEHIISPCIDRLFASLSPCAHNTSAILLSGTGKDGSQGMKALKGEGAQTLVQSPESCEYSGMPEAAIKNGAATHCLPVTEIASELLAVAAGESKSVISKTGIDAVVDVIKTLRMVDLKRLKVRNVHRKCQAQMLRLSIESLDEYAVHLNSNPKDMDRLLTDLLIRVTEFNRDPAVFSSLRQLLKTYMVGRSNKEPFRVWVAGCSTGEEAYSIAIMLLGLNEAQDGPIDFKIFATDISAISIDYARKGCYSLDQLSNLCQAQREKYFSRTKSNEWVVNTDVRESVFFSVHDLLNDHPFARLDLVVCRNVFIYFDKEFQEKALESFLFGLQPNGILVLGSAESIRGFDGLLNPIDYAHRIYKSEATDKRSLSRQQKREQRSSRSGRSFTRTLSRPASIEEEVSAYLAKSFAPASALIDYEGRLIYTCNGMSRFLQHSDGAYANKLTSIIHDDLKILIRSFLQKIRKGKAALMESSVHGVVLDGHKVGLRVKAEKLASQGEGRIIFSFQEISAAEIKSISIEDAAERGGEDGLISVLENELSATRENLQSVVEELETANQELILSNDELFSVNEQLVTANEEYQATNEELNSANEQLYALNQELHDRTLRLEETVLERNEIEQHMDIPVLVVDRYLTITRVNKSAQQVTDIEGLKENVSLNDLVDGAGLIEAIVTQIESLKASNLSSEFVQRIGGRFFQVKIAWLPRNGAEYEYLVVLHDITTLVSTESVVSRERDDAYQTLSSIGDAIVRFDKDNIVRFINPAAYELMDGFNHDAIGRSVESVFSLIDQESDRQAFMSHVCRVFDEDHVHSNGLLNLNLNERGLLAVEYSVGPLISLNRVVGGIIVFRDVSENERLSSQLREERNKLARAQELAQLITIEFNEQGETTVNAELSNLLRRSFERDTLSLEEFARLFNGFQRSRLMSAFRQGENVKSTVFDLSYKSPLGNKLYLSCYYESKAGKSLLVVQDITSRVAAEAFSQMSLRNLETFLSHVAEAIVAINRNGMITVFNPAAEKMFGFKEAEVIGESVSLLMPIEYAAHHGRYMQEFIAGGDPKVIGKTRELSAKRKDGQVFPIFLRVVEMDYDDELEASDDDSHFLATIQDLTEWKRQEEALQRSYRMDAMGQLVGGIAHDFNNILGVLSVNLDLMNQSLAGDSNAKRMERCLKNVDKAKGLTKKFLQFSRRQSQELRCIDSVQLVESVRDMLSRALPRDIELFYSVPNEVLPVLVDQSDFEDSIANLIINAKDAISGRGKIVLGVGQVSVKNASQIPLFTGERLPVGEYVIIQVADTGSGIDRERLNSVLNPFFTTKAPGKGTGLGLSMVYGFIKRSGGQMNIESVPNQGTTMSLYLPMQALDSVEDLEAHVAPPSNISKIKNSSLNKILVVDDELDLLASISDMLVELRYQVVTATYADSAIDILSRDQSIDVVLSDILLPGDANGLDLAKAVKQKNSDIRLGLMTGYVDPALFEQCEALEIPILTKPFSLQQLGEFVQSLQVLE